MRNKKILGALLAVTTLATFGLAGCGNSGSNDAASKEDDKTITLSDLDNGPAKTSDTFDTDDFAEDDIVVYTYAEGEIQSV